MRYSFLHKIGRGLTYRVLTVDQATDAAYCANGFAYYTNVLYEINDIAMYSTIKRSKKWKTNPETKQKAYYISLTQNLLSPAKENSKRWTYGVILDGTELSARYKISPYSGFEECIWLDNDSEFIDVAGCVKGIIVPKDKHFESSDDTMIRNIRKTLGRSTGSFDIVCY